ncbi:MAG TPA: peptidoglycan-binding domain-containing protein [Longimicrobiales bacterium]|nr:peptidoglycan-binding domain-containing protein [Longimicrobiales bacterium]
MKRSLLLPLFAAAIAAAPLAAQTRVTLPVGTVFLVRTDQALESATAQVGQTFTTTIVEDISVNGYVLIPANSRIRGIVSYVQRVTRGNSGVMQVTFDRLVIAGGGTYTIAGKLTSTDSTERRQIDARADSRVVLVGERGGLGAAIAGAGSRSSSASGILAALGNLLSEGSEVAVPAGSSFAVQLEQSLTLTARGSADLSNESTIFTATDRIRAAQQALSRKGYYRGAVNGVFDNATRKALFEFQLDNSVNATGNLDGRTAQALGIIGNGSNVAGGSVLTIRDASVLRRAAQALTARQRTQLETDADVDLYFAFSAFADNSTLYETFVRANANGEATVMAGRALVNAARRVDGALQQSRPSANVQNLWDQIRRQLNSLDSNYR